MVLCYFSQETKVLEKVKPTSSLDSIYAQLRLIFSYSVQPKRPASYVH